RRRAVRLRGPARDWREVDRPRRDAARCDAQRPADPAARSLADRGVRALERVMRVVFASPVPPDVELLASPLEPLPPVVTRALLDERCRDPSIEIARAEETVTDYGWPCVVVRGRRGGAPVLRAYLCFLDHGVLVEARATDLERAWAIVREARP